jgi:membrane fusion protein, copper/silver efflux system
MVDKGVEDRRGGSAGKKILVIALVAGAFGLGYFLSGNRGQPVESSHVHESAVESKEKTAAAKTTYTCSMHPQIKLPKMGKCPICFMDLIPLETTSGDEDDSPITYSMSERAKILAQVETSVVQRRVAEVKRRLVGMVFEDETRISALTSRVDGRLDEIFVDFTGEQVNKGDPMVTIWSPTLIRSQVELFETQRSTEFGESVVKGAEEKLLQYGLTRDQIEEIKKKQKPILYVTLRAPIKGVVMKKNALLGHFVKEGTEMYVISDLSRVWVKLDAYESDLPWLRYGQKVTFTSPAIPGRTFEGRILFIDPVLQMDSRSVKVRVEADNPDLLLKPHMFVTAEVEAEVDAHGRVINTQLGGPAICPVHPDVKGEQGEVCEKSHKKLLPLASYGYAQTGKPALPLVIPATAPLFTGKRSVVYVEVPNRDRPTYQLRDVVLGPKAGNQYVVFKGLKEGERVVTRGNFKIDSAMQILARPSMMSPQDLKAQRKQEPEEPEEEVIEKVEAPKEFLDGLTPAIEEYIKLKDALVEERGPDAAKSAKKMAETMKEMKLSLLPEKAKVSWTELAGTTLKGLKSIADSKGLEAQRTSFDPVSESFGRLLLSFRHAMDKPIYLYLCPMAFNNQGAYWLEASKDLRNPYFGKKMLKCGELVEEIPSEKPAAAAKAEPIEGKTALKELKGEGSPTGSDGGEE